MSDQRFPVEVWIVMNDSGDYVVAADEAAASELADAEWDENAERRYVVLKVTLAAPSDDIQTSVTYSFDEPAS